MDPELPRTLGEAMATEPLWLRAWVGVLIVVNLAAVAFVVTREPGRWRIRPEPIAILVAFFAAGVAMEQLYASVGYVRLLGLAHLVFWGPVWVWILFWRRDRVGRGSPFGLYLQAYLVIAGLSLLIDAVDVVRYLAGDGQLLGRHG